MTTITISAGFWHDHKTVLGEVGKWQLVRSGRRTVTLDMDNEALTELRFNAQRHTERWFWDTGEPEEMRSGINRAYRVLDVILKTQTKESN